jgi:CPA2 family monovalent cation:H+ antiporter-2
MRRLVFGMGSAQVVLTGLVITGVAWGFGNSNEASIVLGACLALSSTAIVMQLLMEQERFGSPVGHGSFAVLLAQDIAVVPILFLVGTLGAHVSGSVVVALALAFGEALLAILVIVVVGRLVLRPVLRFVAGADSPELFMAATLLVIIATAAATHAAGLSAALGAFLAGLLVAECEYRHEIEINIEPFKGLLLGLFFMSVAMGIDLSKILADPGWIAISIVGLFAIKTLITTALARLFAFSWAQAIEMGLMLGQGGEFAFVVVGLALGFELLPELTAQFMLIVVSATMFLTPFVARLARTVGRMIEAEERASVDESFDVPKDLEGHVIIVGYGRTGQLLAALLGRQKIAHVSLDLNPGRVAHYRAEGLPIYLGDARRSAMLAKVGLGRAAALAVCTDDPGATQEVLHAARQLSPGIPIVARARDNDHAASLLALGATQAVPEVLEAGLELGHVTLEHAGIPAHVARDLVDAQRIEAIRGLRPAVNSDLTT